MPAHITERRSQPYFLVGITGNYGAGKSALARIISETELVINSDELARHLTESDVGIRRSIRTEFGDEVFRTDGRLDREALAGIVFADPGKRSRLNSMVHPAVIAEIIEIAECEAKKGNRIIFVESALIYESGIESMFDFIAVVIADEETVIRRLAQQRGENPESIRVRISSQLPPEQKAARADFVVRNIAGKEELRKAASLLLTLVASMARRHESHCT